ncbi:MAG: GNAT family N-acetyltransferase [Planctomycetes bacterium]|nr:GNAT family N-acetyltransferase [Planctomycetota bacterium]
MSTRCDGAGEARVRALKPKDREWAVEVLRAAWGDTKVVTRGCIHNTAELPGLVAVLDGEQSGLITYRLAESECEIVTLNSIREGRGVGTALLAAVRQEAGARLCRRLWLITTNDNLAALRFYQRRGFCLAAVYPGALEHSRALKPEIPEMGREGIPLRDEIELHMLL